jgi:hypothetical protein
MSQFVISVAAVWIFAGGFGLSNTSACADSSPQRDCKPCKRPDGTTNHSPNVTSLTLDKLDLQFKPVAVDPDTSLPHSSPEQIISVTTNAEDYENDVLDYSYTISGGRIIGLGANVSWDLNGTLPGTYTITAKVDDSCGVCGKTITKTVRVIGQMPVAEATPVPQPAAKPQITITSIPPTPAANKAIKSVVIERSTPPQTTRAVNPAPAAAAPPVATQAACPKVMIADPERSGTELVFTTKIFDLATGSRLTYIWTVVGGNVVSQDGRTIRIKPGMVGGSVTVSVNGLDPKGTCPNSAQKTF